MMKLVKGSNNMKIGILSMQRIINYGSFLQSYGLMQILKQFGEDVSFVDYTIEPCLINANLKKKSFRSCLKKSNTFFMKKILTFVKGSRFENFEDFKRKYNDEYLPMIGVTEKRNITPKLDCLVIGSDEVFNCLQTNPDVGYSRELFGARSQAKKVISYAASFGNTTINGLCKYNIVDEVKNNLKKFDRLSVRDENSSFIIHKLLGILPEKNLDTVLIYDFKKETEIIQRKYIYDNYIILYAYSGRISKDEAIAIRNFAKNKNAKLIAIGGTFLFCDECIFPSPFETLCLFKEASYVVTDTFHGSVFSIKYNKQFCVYVRQGEEKQYGNYQKVYDLLKEFKLENRMVTSNQNISDILDDRINYAYVNDHLLVEKAKTMQYFITSLESMIIS